MLTRPFETESKEITGAHCVPPGTQCAPFGHMPPKGDGNTMEESQQDLGTNKNLSTKQKEVLEWLARECTNRQKRFFGIYKKIGKALGTSRLAARGCLQKLKSKELISARPLYAHGSKRAIGLTVEIFPDALEKYFDVEIKTIRREDISERNKNEAMAKILMQRGYHYKAVLGGWVKCKVTPKKQKN